MPNSIGFEAHPKASSLKPFWSQLQLKKDTTRVNPQQAQGQKSAFMLDLTDRPVGGPVMNARNPPPKRKSVAPLHPFILQ